MGGARDGRGPWWEGPVVGGPRGGRARGGRGPWWEGPVMGGARGGRGPR
jgi:hypothetical protein